MSWAADTAAAIIETFQGAFGDGIAVASAAVDESGPVTGLSAGCAAGSRFEIGSVTKTMTATLLALLIGEERAALDDAIGRWLVAGPNGDITLRELVTHTSGLPRLAPSQTAGPIDLANPYVNLTADVAEADLRQAARRPGAGFAYSNFGYQLLGLVLERITGTAYPDLLGERLLAPLSMTCSGVGAAGGGIRISGHAAGEAVTAWDQPLPGAGGAATSVGDLARYLALCASPPDTALGTATRLAQAPLTRAGDRLEIGMSWLILDDKIVFHNGGTNGFAACAGISRAGRQAVAILVNAGPDMTGSALETAVTLVLAGQDPRAARPRPAGPEWDERARGLARALIAGRFGDVHGKLAEAARPLLTVGQIEETWHRAIGQCGEPGEVSVACLTSGAGVKAEVTLRCTRQDLRLAVAFGPAGHVDSLRLLPAAADAPS
jgi:CubicO group peptidase (beta-lactamase class C family)